MPGWAPKHTPNHTRNILETYPKQSCMARVPVRTCSYYRVPVCTAKYQFALQTTSLYYRVPLRTTLLEVMRRRERDAVSRREKYMRKKAALAINIEEHNDDDDDESVADADSD